MGDEFYGSYIYKPLSAWVTEKTEVGETERREGEVNKSGQVTGVALRVKPTDYTWDEEQWYIRRDNEIGG